MRFWLFTLMTLVLLPSCYGEGPIYIVGEDLPEWASAPVAVDPKSDRKPEFSANVVNFHLSPGQRRTALVTGDSWRIPRTYLFGFDVKADRGTLGNERLDLSRLLRAGNREVEIASVQLDARRGITVMGRQCVAPGDLASWHRVEMRIRLRNDDSGFLEVFCDRKPIWAQNGIRTTFPPVCRLSEGCSEPAYTPLRYEWQMGLMADRRVSRHIRVQMRKLHQRELIYIPNRQESF